MPAATEAMCQRCRRKVDCGVDQYCYCGLAPPPREQQDDRPGETRLVVCSECMGAAMREGTDFVCRKRNPNPPVTETPQPSWGTHNI